MNYYLLCSGSKGNCFVLCDKDVKVVIDCGSTKCYLLNKLKEINIDICDIEALLITHNHTDHIAQLKLFQTIKTYAPFDLGDNERVIPEKSFDIKHLHITPIALSHDTEICVGYVFENEEEKLVYITDTGYLKEKYYPLISDADYYVMESNHDVEMLMSTSRPYMLKSRILSDNGHLNNEDCASILKEVIADKTKEIVLAHISQEANTYELALKVNKEIICNENVNIRAARQFEMLQGGKR